MRVKLPTNAECLVVACALYAVPASSQNHHFDGSISREVLKNYLDRSISFTELLHDDLAKPRNERGVDPRDNLRFILDTKAKFVGRALMCWGRDREIGALLQNANGHLETPGSRILTPARGTGGPRWYWANTRSDACPNGFDKEATIKELWTAASSTKPDSFQ